MESLGTRSPRRRYPRICEALRSAPVSSWLDKKAWLGEEAWPFTATIRSTGFRFRQTPEISLRFSLHPRCTLPWEHRGQTPYRRSRGESQVIQRLSAAISAVLHPPPRAFTKVTAAT